MVADVESAVESDPEREPGSRGGVELRLLGHPAIRRDGALLAQPPSRKLRALIAYLAVAPRALTRAHLCELLWDIPNDPRGELRWCLSKARSLLDEPGHRRLQTAQDMIQLDLRDCHVDALELARAMQQGVENHDAPRLRTLLALCGDDFLDGLELDRLPLFTNWLTAQRRLFRGFHAALLEHLVARLPAGSDEALTSLDKWLQLAPLDRQAHALMLHALAARGQWHEGQAHLAVAGRAFEFAGLDGRPLRETWRQLKGAPPHGAWSTDPDSRMLADSASADRLARSGRASIAIMPFVDRSAPDSLRGGLTDGLVHDIITRLAKLRSLFVIAPGTMLALDQRNVGPEEAGRLLNVDYVVSGTLRRPKDRLAVAVELVESRTARIIWGDVLEYKRADALLALDEIGNRIVASIDSEIEAAERNRAILKPPSSLGAWEAHHRGLWHMYRFNRVDNDRARHFFEMAISLDPTFSRAYAGLSFTYWQNAFQGWSDQGPSAELAFDVAGQALIADDRDPAAHWAMGRALWLRGDADLSMAELERAVDLSPNFALAHYTLGFVNCQSGDAAAAILSSDHSRDLSPFDPLLFGMLAVRALALVRLGRYDEAAGWAVRAAARPNAHAHILGIAAYCLSMADRTEEAMGFLAALRKLQPNYCVADLLTAFRLPAETQALFRASARHIGTG